MSIPIVLVDLTSIPFGGEAKLMIRLHPSDKDLVDKAAYKIGLNQAQFMRTAVINSAKAVLKANTATDQSRNFDSD